MEMVHCPGCACDLHDGRAACPVCGAARAVSGAPRASRTPRNPFKLIACCLLWSMGFWFACLLLGGAPLAGTLLLASIGLSIALTVCGALPGTARLNR